MYRKGNYIMIKSPVNYNFNGFSTRTIIPEAFDSLYNTGCYLPKIEQIIFNRGTRKDKRSGEEYQTLTTVLFFADGTKTVVTNSIHDKVVDDNGNVTYYAKEVGITNAICKRILSTVYSDDSVISNGYGRTMKDLVESARDTQEEDKRRAELKAEQKARLEVAKQIKPTHKPSLNEVITQLNDTLKEFNNTIKSDKPNFV